MMRARLIFATFLLVQVFAKTAAAGSCSASSWGTAPRRCLASCFCPPAAPPPASGRGGRLFLGSSGGRRAPPAASTSRLECSSRQVRDPPGKSKRHLVLGDLTRAASVLGIGAALLVAPALHAENENLFAPAPAASILQLQGQGEGGVGLRGGEELSKEFAAEVEAMRGEARGEGAVTQSAGQRAAKAKAKAADDAAYRNLVSKIRTKPPPVLRDEDDDGSGERTMTGRKRDPGPRREKTAEEEEIDRNKLVIKQAWDVIHRGGYGYFGFFDPNNGLFVNPESFYGEARGDWLKDPSRYATHEAALDTIRDMVAQLHDPYSQLLTGESARSEERPPPSVSSSVVPLYGVGLQIFDPLDGFEDLVVVAPVPESPAEQAGIRPLDRITRIDGVDVRQARLTPGEAMELLRGREGSSVDVVIRSARNGAGAVRDVDDAFADRLPRLQSTLGADADDGWFRELQGVDLLRIVRLERETLNIPPVRAGVIDAREKGLGKVGYIRINTFNRKGTVMLEEALKRFEKEEVNGIVIDVRNCLGGQFKEALLTAGMFVKPTDKLINVLDASGFIKEKRGLYQTDMDRWPDTDGRPPTNVPRDKAVVLLTNRGSASSSEVLVAAIADNRPATIIGERTYGKALIQHPYRLIDGSILKLTVAEYLSPTAQHIGSGIYPSRMCSDSPMEDAGDGCVRLAQEQIAAATGGRMGKSGPSRGGSKDEGQQQKQTLVSLNRQQQPIEKRAGVYEKLQLKLPDLRRGAKGGHGEGQGGEVVDEKSAPNLGQQPSL